MSDDFSTFDSPYKPFVAKGDTKFERIEPDYKQAFGTLAYLVGKANAFAVAGNAEASREFLAQADLFVQRFQNTPGWMSE